VKEEFSLSFENKVALVTGAGSGMGLATATAFAEAGASVALADAFLSRGAILPCPHRLLIVRPLQ
jgi:NAD(P)-dependent dehydrogenase (short-subunit alcohol dehydrogenase family)